MDKIALKASGNGTLNISELEHPNRMPFSGVLTYLNRLSTEPPHGSNGLRVFIPTDVGAPAVASLKGMAVNYIQNNPTGHDPRQKVGVITDAKLGETQPDGAVPVLIEGYIYSLDFEDAATSIKASQSILGFSYETAQTQLIKGEVNGVPAAVVTSLGYFTGASILYRDSASYADTSLAASIDNKEEHTLDFEKLLAELKSAFKEEVDALRQEFSHKPEVVKAEEAVEEEVSKAEEVVAIEVPKVEEAAKEVAQTEVAKAEEVVATEAPKVEEAVIQKAEGEVTKVEEAVAPAAQPTAAPVAEEATLNASSLLAEIKSLKDELAALKDNASIQAASRKSILYPTSPLAKYDLAEVDDKTKLLASIDSNTQMTVEEKLAAKFEARAKFKN